MTRQPFSDERSVLPPFDKRRNTGRIYLMELARFLRVKVLPLGRFLARRGLIYGVIVRRNGAKARWTTPRGAQVAIVHYRAKQAEMWLRGRNPFEQADLKKRRMAAWADKQERKRGAEGVARALVAVGHTEQAELDGYAVLDCIPEGRGRS